MKRIIKTIKSIPYSKSWTAYLMAAPGVILLTVFVIVPFIFTFIYSFTNRMLIENPIVGTQFVGFGNYKSLFNDSAFYKSFLNNLTFTVFEVPLVCTLSLPLAILVNQKIRGVGFFRLVYYSPVVIPMLVTSVMWSLMFIPDETGFFNSILNSLTNGAVGPIRWLRDPNTAMMSIIIMSTWAGVGYQMIIYLGGLQSIPGEIYESARIDGANAIKTFFYITIPQLKNTIIFLFLSTTVMSFKMFTQVFALTGGGPMGSTSTVVYMIYSAGYTDQRIGYASSIAVVFFVVVLLISLVQQKFTNMEKS